MKSLEDILKIYGKDLETLRSLPVGKSFYFSVDSEPGEETSGVFVFEGEKIQPNAIKAREGYAEFRSSEPSLGDYVVYYI